MESSSFGRLFGVLFSPGKTFRSIAERPTWLVALIVLALAGVVVSQAVNARTDQREMLEKQMEKWGQNLTEEQLNEAVEKAENPSPLGRTLSIVGGFFFQGVFYLIPAFLYWVFFKVTGSEMALKSSFSTYLHSSMPIGVGALLSIPVILSRATVEPLDALTGELLASSPAFLLPETASVTTRAVLATFDLFNLWSVVLAIVGYRIVARVSTTAAVFAAVLFFLVGMGIRVGIANLLG